MSMDDLERAEARKRQMDELRKAAIPLKGLIVSQVKLGIDLKYLALRYTIEEERLAKLKAWLDAKAESSQNTKPPFGGLATTPRRA